MNVRMDRNVNPVIEETCLLGVFCFVLFCFFLRTREALRASSARGGGCVTLQEEVP